MVQLVGVSQHKVLHSASKHHASSPSPSPLEPFLAATQKQRRYLHFALDTRNGSQGKGGQHIALLAQCIEAQGKIYCSDTPSSYATRSKVPSPFPTVRLA